MIYDKQMTFEEISDDYKAFLDSFSHRMTRDDCYTYANIYDVVRDWACAKYGIDPATIVRPFFPGGDYERFDYPDGCFVLDNPPFSLTSQICRFYIANKIGFFLFAYGLTPFCVADNPMMHYVICGTDIDYENGAVVNTSFITSEGEYCIETAPDLHRMLTEANEKNRKVKKRKLIRSEMPDCVVNAPKLGWIARHGGKLRIRREDVHFERVLDCGYGIHGGGFILSERAAAERAAAERAAAERAAAERAAAVKKVTLSEREIAIHKRLGK